MNAVNSCPCKQDNLNKNSPPCQFVQIYDKLPECPCSCVPSVNSSPPCPFKSPAPGMLSPFQCVLQADQNGNTSASCPLSSRTENTSTTFPKQSQLCGFAENNQINFKEWPQYQCACVPGTCPERSKNLIRSWGFDPFCSCLCPKSPAAATIQSEGVVTVEKSKSSQTVSKTNLKSSSSRTVSAIKLAGAKDNLPPSESMTAGVEGSSKTLREPSKVVISILDPTIAGDGANESLSKGELVMRGKGFAIYNVDGKKVLFNYATKNCKWLKCECSAKMQSCGCDEWKRITNYRNCCCPGARKQQPVKKQPVLKDQRISRDEAPDGRKSVKYSKPKHK